MFITRLKESGPVRVPVSRAGLAHLRVMAGDPECAGLRIEVFGTETGESHVVFLHELSLEQEGITWVQSSSSCESHTGP